MRAVPLAALLLVVLVVAAGHAVADRGEEEEDAEVAACKQQCARERQFGAPERRYCVARCDEYGRMKKREEEKKEGPEKERDRCLHECRAGPRKPGCERRCLDEYERAATRGHGGGPGDGAVAGRWFRGKWHDAAA